MTTTRIDVRGEEGERGRERVRRGRGGTARRQGDANRVQGLVSSDSAPDVSDPATRSNRRTTRKVDVAMRRGEDSRSLKNPQSSRAYQIKRKSVEPLAKIEWPEYFCEKCGEPITDLTQALSDKESGKPVHFECILSFLKNSEELKEQEEVVYIGNGNFAVVYFDNPKIRSKFKIVKLIEWEESKKTYEWRVEVANLGSCT